MKGSEVILWSSARELKPELLMELRACVGVGNTDIDDISTTLLSCIEVRLEVNVDVLAGSSTELVCSVTDELTATPAVLTSCCRLVAVAMEDVVGATKGGCELAPTTVFREEVVKPVVDATTGVFVNADIA